MTSIIDTITDDESIRKFCIAIMFLMLVCAFIHPVAALPTAGAPTGITSNNVTIPITGATGPVFVKYGEVSGQYVWYSDNWTAAQNQVIVWGAPLIGGQVYYGVPCDSTGCGNQVTWTMLAITPVPTNGYDAGFNTIVTTHFNIALLPAELITAYTANIPVTIVFGMIMGFITIGIWRRTKSVRLISIIFIIVGPLLISNGNGLYLGMPAYMQSIGAVLFSAGIAGILLSLIKK